MAHPYHDVQSQYYLQPGEQGELPPSDPMQMPANGFDPRFDVDKNALENNDEEQRGHVLSDVSEARSCAGGSWIEYSTLLEVSNPTKLKSPTFAWTATAVLSGTGGGQGRHVTLRQIKEGVLEADELPTLLADVQKMQALRHQHLVALLGVTCCNLTGFDQPHTYALVTEHMAEACTLKEFMQRQISQPGKRVYTDNDALRISLQIAKGLRFLHENRRRTWHRNLHPSTVWLIGENPSTVHVKIGDFALDTLITRPTDEKAQSLAAKIMPGRNTDNVPAKGLNPLEDDHFLYLAPEVIKGAQYTDAADVYSFAWLLYELYMREIVYESAVAKGKVKDFDGFVTEYTLKGLRPGFPSNRIPSGVAEVIAACWAASAGARPPVSAVVQQLQDWMMANGVDEQGGKEADFQKETPQGCSCTIC